MSDLLLLFLIWAVVCGLFVLIVLAIGYVIGRTIRVPAPDPQPTNPRSSPNLRPDRARAPMAGAMRSVPPNEQGETLCACGNGPLVKDDFDTMTCKCCREGHLYGEDDRCLRCE